MSAATPGPATVFVGPRVNYQTQFTDFVLDVEIPKDWIDTSWHNDACPSWEVSPGGPQVYVDYADPKMREFPGIQRFSVHVYKDGESAIPLVTDDWAEVLAYLADPDPKGDRK